MEWIRMPHDCKFKKIRSLFAPGGSLEVFARMLRLNISSLPHLAFGYKVSTSIPSPVFIQESIHINIVDRVIPR
jgi:hypothetical protein